MAAAPPQSTIVQTRGAPPQIHTREVSMDIGQAHLRKSSADSFLEECRTDMMHKYQHEVVHGMGMGGVNYITDISPEELRHSAPKGHDEMLGELPSTAICGNDISGSVFYVTGELAQNAGVYAPICTLLSSFTLFCFRSIYGEVVTALPLNGGIYNLLLNSSSKSTASVAACLTILSYTATGVVSSVSAAEYIQQASFTSELEIVPTAIIILAFFAVLMILGMKESSFVATILFIFHLSILFMVAMFSVMFLLDVGLDQFRANLSWHLQPPFLQSIFFGFSSAMLGVSGFETSANFVEEQKPGVFPKTLTNMWLSVSFINIILPSFAIAILPLEGLIGPESAFVIAALADRVGGTLMRDVVACDALLVLAGGVLTCYVGVVGLVQRMAGDNCLPAFFSHTNAWRGTPHITILAFFATCSSMCIVLEGKIVALSAMYSIAFLLVMGLFAFCGLWMKVTRPTLPRQIHTHPAKFLLGLILVSTAFTAVVLLHPETLTTFYIYYGITVLMVMTTFARMSIFTAFIKALRQSRTLRTFVKIFVSMDIVQTWTLDQMQALRNQGVGYFTKSGNLSQINRAIQYIEANEEARWVRVIHIYQEDDSDAVQHLPQYVQFLDCVYPKIKIDCVLVKGKFGPAIVQRLAERIGVPVNCLFINCPKHDFEHPLDTMGGVRVIMNSERSTMLDNMTPSSTREPSEDRMVFLTRGKYLAAAI